MQWAAEQHTVPCSAGCSIATKAPSTTSKRWTAALNAVWPCEHAHTHTPHTPTPHTHTHTQTHPTHTHPHTPHTHTHTHTHSGRTVPDTCIETCSFRHTRPSDNGAFGQLLYEGTRQTSRCPPRLSWYKRLVVYITHDATPPSAHDSYYAIKMIKNRNLAERTNPSDYSQRRTSHEAPAI